METRLEKPRAWVVDVATRRIVRKPHESALPTDKPLAQPVSNRAAPI